MSLSYSQRPGPPGPCLPGDPHSLSLSFNPSAARRSNQSIPREINPEYSLEGLILKLQYFGHLMRKVDSMEKTLMLRQKEKGVAEDEMIGWHH